MEPIRLSSTGPCPHCLVTVRFTSALEYAGVGQITEPINHTSVYSGELDGATVYYSVCPNCRRLVVSLVQLAWDNDTGELLPVPGTEIMCQPLLVTGRPVASEVPLAISKAYRAAGAIIGVSPEASAALSRRCLQSVLRNQGYDQRDISDQIKAAKSGSELPTYIADDLDNIRVIGNFGAHPNKDVNSRRQ